MNTFFALYRFTMLRNGVNDTPLRVSRVTVTSNRCVEGNRIAFRGPPTTWMFCGLRSVSQRPVLMSNSCVISCPLMYVYGVPDAYPSRAAICTFGDDR